MHAVDSLVDLQQMVSLSEIQCEGLGRTHTLECRVHKASVAKVTEPSGSRRNPDLRWAGLLFIIDNNFF